ncbi:hypothetical protein EBR77_01955 [bacterium]|nr:hypothetical protein [bacterium]
MWGDNMKQVNRVFFLIFFFEMIQAADGRRVSDAAALNRARLASLWQSQTGQSAGGFSKDALPQKVESPVQTAGGPHVIEGYFGKTGVQSPRESSGDGLDQSQTSSSSTLPIRIPTRVSRQSPSDTSPLAIEVLKRSMHAKSAGDEGMVYGPIAEESTMGKSAPSDSRDVRTPLGAALSIAFTDRKPAGEEIVDDEAVDVFCAHKPLQKRDGLVTTEGLGEPKELEADERIYHSTCISDDALFDGTSSAADLHDVLLADGVKSPEQLWPEGEVPEKTWIAKDGTKCAFFRYKDPTYGAFLAEVFSGGTTVSEPVQISKSRKLKQD